MGMVRRFALLSLLLVVVLAVWVGPGVTPVFSSPPEKILKLPDITDKIVKGKITVGKKYGMETEKRYHEIHATKLGLACSTCHVEKIPPEAKFGTLPTPVGSAPGPIDRRICLGCHSRGPARELYGQ